MLISEISIHVRNDLRLSAEVIDFLTSSPPFSILRLYVPGDGANDKTTIKFFGSPSDLPRFQRIAEAINAEPESAGGELQTEAAE